MALNVYSLCCPLQDKKTCRLKAQHLLILNYGSPILQKNTGKYCEEICLGYRVLNNKIWDQIWDDLDYKF